MGETYRWVGDVPRKRHRQGERFEHGDEFEPTDHELRAFSESLELVEDDTDTEPAITDVDDTE